MLMVCLLISGSICWGTIKHVMPRCRVRAHTVDIVLVAQISIFTQTMRTGGGRGGGVSTKKEKVVVEGWGGGGEILQFSSESPKTLNNFLPN